MYAYNLLVYSPKPRHVVDADGYPFTWTSLTPPSPDPVDWDHVRPGPDMEIATLEELKAQVDQDLGFVPKWLETLDDPDEYIGVEDDVEVRGTWFMLEIEGSQSHVLPPLAERIAWERAARDGTLDEYFPRPEEDEQITTARDPDPELGS